MVTAGKEDLRVRKTLAAIHGTFNEMLLAMPYEKITVTELSERARINKKTFYRCYPTLDALLEEVQLAYARPFVERTSGLRYPGDTDAIVREFLLYSSEQGPLYDVILTSGAYSEILMKVIDEMSVERLAQPPSFQMDQRRMEALPLVRQRRADLALPPMGGGWAQGSHQSHGVIGRSPRRQRWAYAETMVTSVVLPLREVRRASS